MVRRLVASVALLLPFCVPAAAHAAQSDIARYVLPPGNYGGIPAGPHSLDQLPLYSGLTPLRRNVSMSDVFHFYLPMNFRPIGATQIEPVGRSDGTVTYDAYGIPHINGKTVHGKPYALARKRSTYGQDALSLAAVKAMTEGRATTPQLFWKFANRFGFTFNWGYVSRTSTSFFSSGRLPVRARGLDPPVADARHRGL